MGRIGMESKRKRRRDVEDRERDARGQINLTSLSFPQLHLCSAPIRH